MKNKIICIALSTAAMSNSAIASQATQETPFVDLDTHIVDIYIDNINRSLISSKSYDGVAGFKSNFGSDCLYLNLYNGNEVSSPTSKVSFKGSENNEMSDIKDRKRPLFGIALEFFFVTLPLVCCYVMLCLSLTNKKTDTYEK